jgi:hypothetical protein
VGGCRHEDRVCCHVLFRWQNWVLRAGDGPTGMRGRYHGMRAFPKPNSAANTGSAPARRDRRRTYRSRSVLASRLRGSDSGLLLVDGQIGSHRFVRRNWYR